MRNHFNCMCLTGLESFKILASRTYLSSNTEMSVLETTILNIQWCPEIILHMSSYYTYI